MTTDKYLLDQSTLPTIPVPHDCIITGISEDAEFLIFKFEKDISSHDAIRAIHPTARSLIIRFHKDRYFDEDAELYRYSHRKGGYISKEYKELCKIIKRKKDRLVYLTHFVGWHEMIIELTNDRNVMLKIRPDYVEYQWIEAEM